MRLLTRGLVALVLIMLSGCSLLNRPPGDLLARCLITPDGTHVRQPFSMLIDGLKQKHGKLRWQRDPNGDPILHVTLTDPLSGASHLIAMSIERSDDVQAGASCGPKSAKVTRLMLDGEDQNPIGAANFLVGFVQTQLKAGQIQAAAAPAPPPPSPSPTPLSNQAAAQENTDDDEIEADQEFYAEQANAAAAKQVIVSDGLYRYCCLTVGDVLQRFEGQGAKATIDTEQPSHIVTIDVQAPNGSWRGLKQLTLEFDPQPGHPDQLVLGSVTSNERQIAIADGVGAQSTVALLKEQFPLSAKAD